MLCYLWNFVYKKFDSSTTCRMNEIITSLELCKRNYIYSVTSSPKLQISFLSKLTPSLERPLIQEKVKRYNYTLQYAMGNVYNITLRKEEFTFLLKNYILYATNKKKVQ